MLNEIEDFYDHATEVEADKEFTPIDFEDILNKLDAEKDILEHNSQVYKGCPFCPHPVQVLEKPDAYGNRYVCPLGHCGMPTSEDWETRAPTKDFERGYAHGLDAAANTITAEFVKIQDNSTNYLETRSFAEILRDEAKRVRKENGLGDF